MHNVVNISHLWLYCLDSDPTQPKLVNPRDDMLVSEEYELEKIIGHQKWGKGLVYQVRWKGYDVADNNWVMTQDLHNAPEELQWYHW